MKTSNPLPETNDKEQTFHWYAVIPDARPLEQGDLLNDFPIVIPPSSLGESSIVPTDQTIEVETVLKLFNVVVMTQSCDLKDFGDENHVILCPRYVLKEARTASGKRLANTDGWAKLIRGNIVGSHLINKCDLGNHEFDYQVIDLQYMFTVPYAAVKWIAANRGDRVRLLPPYREHLAQAFTRQFMRVGLPIDLPRKYPYQSR